MRIEEVESKTMLCLQALMRKSNLRRSEKHFKGDSVVEIPEELPSWEWGLNRKVRNPCSFVIRAN